MAPKLFVLLEGQDDIRFFNYVLAPYFQQKYSLVLTIPYSRKAKRKNEKLIQSIKSKSNDYLLFYDSDGISDNTIRINKLKCKSCSNLEENNAVVVKYEIESWYAAGMTESFTKKYGIPTIGDTEIITKEKFDEFTPQSFTRTDFMMEILKLYSVKIATTKNNSLETFYQIHLHN